MDRAVVVLGGSQGGATAIAALLTRLPRDFPAPLVVTLHRGKQSDDTLIDFLRKASPLPVREAEDKVKPLPGCVYLAPADYHLLVEKDGLALSTEAPVNWARPSINVLFESAAETWRERAVAILLTGANSDGAEGLARIKQCGGLTVVQEPGEAECRVMPDAAIRAAAVDRILPLAEIASFLMETFQPRVRVNS